MRILIITSCTGHKAVDHERKLTQADFAQGPEHVAAREAELADLLTRTEDLYTGEQHVRLMRGVRQLRDSIEPERDLQLDVRILSAGYGLVPGNRLLAPYDCTFEGMKKRELRAWADQLGVPGAIREVLVQPYDLAFLLLGEPYLEACALDDGVSLGGPTIAFTSTKMASRLPQLPNLRTVVLRNRDATRFSCGLVSLKGELTARLLQRVASNQVTLEQLQDEEVDVLSFVDEPKAHSLSPRPVARPNPAVDRVIDIPESWWQKPHRKKLMYFIPEWDDLVDPDYDFEADTHSGGTGDWSNEVYAHQLYAEPNYDGILVSRVVAEKTRSKRERINAMGVHRYLRVPPEFPIMGDCGAFGYINQEVPPYTTEDVLDYYTRLGFNYGVSVDHLIVSSTHDERQFRYEVTLHNADEFLREHHAGAFRWKPIGAVQGWDAESYAAGARQVTSMGYDHIGLGGLVRSSTREIIRVLQAVKAVIPAGTRLHLFGLARLRALYDFQRLGVTSVDSASYLRQAWMRDSQGYLLEHGSFAALRIPESGKSFRAKRMVTEGLLDQQKVRLLELAALKSVRAFASRQCSLESCLDALLDYDSHISRDRKDMTELYERTLVERPWEQCTCAVCSTWGVETIIFRGNNRNRRRGFHNTFVFYRLIQHLTERGGASEGEHALQLPLLDITTSGSIASTPRL